MLTPLPLTTISPHAWLFLTIARSDPQIQTPVSGSDRPTKLALSHSYIRCTDFSIPLQLHRGFSVDAIHIDQFGRRLDRENAFTIECQTVAG